MKLKAVVDTLEGLPDWAKELYVPKDGKFTLELEGEIPGFLPKARIDEFRNANIALAKQLEELEKNGLKLTPEQKEEYERLAKQYRENKDKELIDAGKIDELLAQRTEQMRKDHEAKYNALNSKFEETLKNYQMAEQRLAKTLITSEISKNISTVGSLRKGAMDDVLNRAQNFFKYKDGNIMALDGDGSPIYGKDGKTPMSVTEWCQSLAENAPYLFENSSGGGSNGNNNSVTGMRTISKGDNKGFITNLDAIAKGEVQVSGTAQ